jgi:hypothetical protein
MPISTLEYYQESQNRHGILKHEISRSSVADYVQHVNAAIYCSDKLHLRYERGCVIVSHSHQH